MKYSHNYRILLDNVDISESLANEITSISVHQEIDLMWEAQINFKIRLDTTGNWSVDNHPMLNIGARVRIELKSDQSDFVPLIDGPVANFLIRMSHEPNTSAFVAIIFDDTIFLNTTDEINKYDGTSAEQIVNQVFGNFDEIKSIIIDAPLGFRPQLLDGEIVQRGSAIKFLKNLAKKYGRLCYVLPGSIPSTSTGYFVKLSYVTNHYTAIVLNGTEKNIQSVDIYNYGFKPYNSKMSTLLITNKNVISGESSVQSVPTFGSNLGFRSSIVGNRFLHPDLGPSVDLNSATYGPTESSSFSIRADCVIDGSKYPDILQPYNQIDVIGIGSIVSGPFLIQQVIHEILPNSYSLRVKLQKNASEESNLVNQLTNVIGGLF